MIENLDATYWNNRYLEQSHRWDLGEVSPPLKAYIDQLENKELKILIPGGGNSYEAEYLFYKGFKNVYVVDVAAEPLKNLKNRVLNFPAEHLLHQDFFTLEDTFDLVLEQTFFCALHPKLRGDYVLKMNKLLRKGGKLVGLLFNAPLNKDKPPFGGSKSEYINLFQTSFNLEKMDACYSSHPTRNGRELFVVFKNQDPHL